MVENGGIEPDLAFVDLHMPRKNGFSLLAALASRPQAGFPMVVLTSSNAPTDALRSRLRGAIRVVSKPDTFGEMKLLLTSAINTVCPRRASVARAPTPKDPGAPSQARRFPGISGATIDEQ